MRTDQAARDIRKKKTEYISDAAQRQRIGQIEDAQQSAEYNDVLQQEADLTAGHGILRTTGLIAVSAKTPTSSSAPSPTSSRPRSRPRARPGGSGASRPRRSRLPPCLCAGRCDPRTCLLEQIEKETAMPTFENPAVDADEVQTALRALAHATRSIEDPRQIYSVLGSLTSAVASLSQSLHQLATFHDDAANEGRLGRRRLPGRTRSRRSRCHGSSTAPARSSIRCRASIASAHNAESRITYTHRDFPELAEASQPVSPQRAPAVNSWDDGRLHSAVLVSPRRERRRDRRTRRAAANVTARRRPRGAEGSSDGEGRRTGGRASRDHCVAQVRRARPGGSAHTGETAPPASSGHLGHACGRVPVPRRGRPRQRGRVRRPGPLLGQFVRLRPVGALRPRS
jgi:hypothetical protein